MKQRNDIGTARPSGNISDEFSADTLSSLKLKPPFTSEEPPKNNEKSCLVVSLPDPIVEEIPQITTEESSDEEINYGTMDWVHSQNIAIVEDLQNDDWLYE